MDCWWVMVGWWWWRWETVAKQIAPEMERELSKHSLHFIAFVFFSCSLSLSSFILPFTFACHHILQQNIQIVGIFKFKLKVYFCGCLNEFVCVCVLLLCALSNLRASPGSDCNSTAIGNSTSTQPCNVCIMKIILIFSTWKNDAAFLQRAWMILRFRFILEIKEEFRMNKWMNERSRTTELNEERTDKKTQRAIRTNYRIQCVQI